MPFVHRQSIDPALRKKHDADYRARLRETLLDPGLTAAQRQSIKAQLAQVGQGKVYRADTPPKPGAVRFEDGASKAP